MARRLVTPLQARRGFGFIDIQPDGSVQFNPDVGVLSVGGSFPIAGPSPWIDITHPDYGADPTGVNDSYPAIQKAWNVSSAYGIATMIPTGLYLLSQPLQAPSNLTCFGFGPLSALKGKFSTGTRQIIMNDLVNGNSNITFLNFRVDRSDVNSQHGILMNGVTGLRFDGLEVVGRPPTISGAIGLSGSSIGNTSLLSENVRIANCYIQDAEDYGIEMSMVRNVSIVGNVFNNCWREVIGVEVKTADIAHDITIMGNTIILNMVSTDTGDGVIIIDMRGYLHGVTVMGNTIDNLLPTTPGVGTQTAGILLLGNPTVPAPLEDVIVMGNIIRNMNGPGIQAGSAGYEVYNAIIKANQIIKCCNYGGLPGIDLANCVNSKITHNIINSPADSVDIAEAVGYASNNDIKENYTPRGITANGGGTVVENNRGYNPVGISTLTVGASPFTYAAQHTKTTLYISGGTVTGISVGGTQVSTTGPATITLEAGESISVSFTAAPTIVADVH